MDKLTLQNIIKVADSKGYSYEIYTNLMDRQENRDEYQLAERRIMERLKIEFRTRSDETVIWGIWIQKKINWIAYDLTDLKEREELLDMEEIFDPEVKALKREIAQHNLDSSSIQRLASEWDGEKY